MEFLDDGTGQRMPRTGHPIQFLREPRGEMILPAVIENIYIIEK